MYLMQMQDWLEYNQLSANVSKTKYMVFSTKGMEFDIDIKLGGAVLEEVKFFKYLGLIIDNRLCFDHHIKCLTSKLNLINGSIYAMKKLVPHDLLRNIYFALVYPHLILHIIIWGVPVPLESNIFR